MPIIRLLHLSDLHIGRRRKRDPENIFQKYRPHSPGVVSALAELCYRNRDSFDAIVITGDLAHSGRAEDLDMARRFLLTPAGRSIPWLNGTQPTLAGAGRPIYALPGNHDRYQGSPAKGKPGGVLFDATFAKAWPTGFGGVDGIAIPSEADPQVLAVRADFALRQAGDADRKKFAKHGQGRVYLPQHLDRLKAETDRLRKAWPSRAVLWFVHFAPEFERVPIEKPPYNLKKFDSRLRLIDGDEFLEAAKNCGVTRILCGHTHIRLVYKASADASVTIHCAGSAGCIGEDTSIHLLHVGFDEGNITNVDVQDKVWDGHFVSGQPRVFR